MPDTERLAIKKIDYDHGDKEYCLRFDIRQLSNSSPLINGRVKMSVYECKRMFFGLYKNRMYNRIAYRKENCSTGDFADTIEELKQVGKRIADDHAQTMEAVECISD